jgi:hypothetical protein
MKTLDLIDRAIQEAEHLTIKPRDVEGTTSFDKLFAVLERGPVGQASPEYPVTQIEGAPRIQMVADGSTGQPPSDGSGLPKPDIISNFSVSTQTAPSTSANGWVEAQMPEL